MDIMKLLHINLSNSILVKIAFFLTFILHTSLGANTHSIDLNTTIDNATKHNKQVAVFFHMNNCAYCNRMENDTLQNDSIRNMIKKDFILVDINISQNKNGVVFNDKTYTNHQFAKSSGVTFYPTVLFFDKDYNVSYKVRGHRNSEKFKKILEFIQTKSYEWMDFFDYEKEGKE